MDSSNYTHRTPDYYLSKLEPDLTENLSSAQLQAFRNLLNEAISKPSPKIVDLRFVVDLIVTQFYVVLFVGKDRRKNQRRYVPKGIARLGNAITVTVLLLGANLFISALIILVVYLLKSAVGVDLLPGHFPDLIKQILPGG
jgi:hypothetical protein